MNICLITDKNYLIGTMTAIKSLILNNNKESLFIYVMCNKLSKTDCEQLKILSTDNAQINLIDVSESIMDIIIEHSYISKTALLKFYIPNLFKDVNKMLYIDDDIIVHSSIKDLYSTDIENCYAGVVQDMNATLCGHDKKIGHKKFFNSGMMLLNLKKMRDDGIVNELIEYKKNEKFNDFVDQNAFNAVFKENVIYLSPKYNYLTTIEKHSIQENAEFFNIPLKDFYSISKKPVIIHYAGACKPWKDRVLSYFEIYTKYLFILPDCTIKKLTINNLFKHNYLMYLKFYLRQFAIFSWLIDLYEKFKYKNN